MSIGQYIIDNLLPIAIAVAGAVAWFFDKRRRLAEVESITTLNNQAKANALEGMQEAYAEFVKEVQRQLSDVKKENKELKAGIATLKEELKNSNREREELKEQIRGFISQSEKDAKLISELKRKVESYEVELRKFKNERV